MASVMSLCLVLIVSFIHFGNSLDKILAMECQSVVGVIGQTTNIACSFKSRAASDFTIDIALLNKTNKKIFTFSNGKVGGGDPRFNFAIQNKPSLLLRDTSISDEGEYSYIVYTDRGVAEIKFNITVTAKFNPPVIDSFPKEVKDGQKVDLYCNSSGGYPAGSIHWFDQSGLTNWTASSTLKSTVGADKLVHLFSHLSITSFDTNWAPFKCLILNSKGIVEEESQFTLKIIGNEPETTNNQSRNIAAAVVVIGSLIVGLLLVLMFRRRRAQHRLSVPNADPEQDSDDLSIEAAQRSN
ncbi:CD276 antigen [Brachyhypopomus gauderio]|uniref:CD276 antigen n=1 Tax=Brachyhypopomus gauderio TaxID=698409 RepID=UPI00404179A0